MVWTAAVRQFENHPVLGVGGGIGGKVVISHIGNMYLEQMSSLHNGFLEVLTGLGTGRFFNWITPSHLCHTACLEHVERASGVCRYLRSGRSRLDDDDYVHRHPWVDGI